MHGDVYGGYFRLLFEASQVEQQSQKKKMFSPTKAPAPPPQAATATAAAAKKRRRDISSLANFKHHMYTKGIQDFYAAVEANPILMYPPAGVEEAREHLKLLGVLADTPGGAMAAGITPLPAHGGVSEAAEDTAEKPPHRRDPVDIDQFLRELEDPSAQQSSADHPPPSPTSLAADPQAANTPAAKQSTHHHLADAQQARELQAAATYHRTQLNALVAMFYDFNHTQFVKLPVKQTTELLLRCGREAYAHLSDFENEERNRKNRIISERMSSRKQKEQVAVLMNEGRSDYFDDQLRRAEVANQEQPPTNEYDGFDVEEDADEDMLAHIRNQQNDDMVYSMFPEEQDDDADGGDSRSVDVAGDAFNSDNVTDGPLASTVDFEVSSALDAAADAASATLRVAATVVDDDSHRLTETLFCGVSEAQNDDANDVASEE